MQWEGGCQGEERWDSEWCCLAKSLTGDLPGCNSSFTKLQCIDMEILVFLLYIDHVTFLIYYFNLQPEERGDRL